MIKALGALLALILIYSLDTWVCNKLLPPLAKPVPVVWLVHEVSR